MSQNKLIFRTSIGLFRLLRPKQWIKNGFVLAPIVFSGLFLDTKAVTSALLAALFFSLAASATYILNDINDVDRDRLHPKKSQTRPIAAGDIAKSEALMLLAVIFLLLMSGWLIFPSVMIVISAYLILNIAYSYSLKHKPVIDIFTVAIGFVLRIYAGACAINVAVSSWMLVTTLCLALYLAAVKRRQELDQNGSTGREVLEKYTVALVDRYAEMSATGAILFYSMYVMSSKPQLVYTIPLVLFGLFRYWYVVDALDGGESPTDALLVDPQLLATVILWIVACGWALWPT